MSKKSVLLRMAADLEDAAKTEEVFYVRFIDLTGRTRQVHRYHLPFVAEDFRREAALLPD